MAFQRYRKFRRYTTSKRYPRRSNTAQIARKAYQMARKVSSKVTSEWKYEDTAIAGGLTDLTASITLLTGVDQGTDSTQRIGHTLGMKSLYLNGDFRALNEPTVLPTRIRYMIVRCMDDNNSTAPTLANLLAQTTDSTFFNSALNKDEMKKWRVLRDKRFIICDQYPTKVIKEYIKFGMMKDRQGNRSIVPQCTFHGTGYSNVDYGHCYLVICTSNGTGTDNVGFNGFSRFSFVDN